MTDHFNAHIGKPPDTECILAPLLYILSKTGGKLDKHKLFKILYFADKEHIAKFGITFSEDTYIKMKYGPVPSRLFEYIRILEGKYTIPVFPEIKEIIAFFISINEKMVISNKKPKSKYLSQSAITVLDNSINKYKYWSFANLLKASHDLAWHSAPTNGPILLTDIAKAAGANEAMVAYIKEMN